MKASFLLLLMFIGTSCGSNRENNDATKAQYTAKIDTTGFNDFLKRFSTDSSYQFQSIIFPLTTCYYGPENYDSIMTKDLNQKDWTIVNLINPVDPERTYFISRDITPDATVVVRIGAMDSGVHLEFEFFLRSGRWYMKKFSNLST